MENEEKDIFFRPENGGRTAQAEGVSGPSSYPPEGETAESERDFLTYEKKDSPFSFLKDKKKLLLVAGAILVVIALTLGARNFLSPRPAPASPSQDALILDPIMQAMRSVDSYSYDGAMTFGRTLKVQDQKYGMEYRIIYKGVTEKGGGNPALYSSLVYDTVRSIDEAQNITSVGLQSVAIGGKKYLKIDNILIAGKDQTSKAAIVENNLKGVSGNWYAVTDEDYRSFYDTVKSPAFLPEEFDLLSVEGVSNFNRIFDYGVLSAPQNLGSEPIEEIDTIHYKVNLNTPQVLELITTLAENGDGERKDGGIVASIKNIKNDQAQAEKFQKVVDYVMQKVETEIWVGKSDNLIYRFRIAGKFDDAAIDGFYAKLKDIYGGSYADSGSDEEGMSFDVDYTLSGFNTAKVRDVEGAKDFGEVTAKLNVINPGSVAVKPSTADTDSDGLTDEEEKKYGSDPGKADTDGDGYGDGSEVRGGYDPVVAGEARLDYNKLNRE